MLQLPSSVTRHVITVIAVLMSCFHLYIAFVGPPDSYVMRGGHLAFALALAFLLLPGRNGHAERVGWFDLVLLLAAVCAALYPAANLSYIEGRMYYVDDPRIADYVFGGALVVLIIEATRRATGWALPVTAIVFMLYGLTVGGQSFSMMLDQTYLTTEGIFGIPLYVSATYVMLFILFGSFVERSGAGQLFMDFALAIAGHTSGGPAKVAVITSSLFGTVSGSAVANVMTTGTFTIPLMMRTGYRPAFAGAVEAVASTGGQLMPPIMGAAAFVMAEFLGISYLTVAGFALLPAVLYYLAVFMAVHFEAKRIGLVGLPKADLPRMKQVLLERGHLFLPLIVIVVVLLAGRSAAFSALCGIGSVIPTTWLRASTRRTFTWRAVVEALEAGARNTLVVALACACAGIVIGTITLTGLGLSFTGVVLALSQNSLVLALVLTMLAGILLGMGLPTTPAYIVQVALLVPALVKLGVRVEAAHLFVLYFSVLSAITPPVAMAVYAANGISRGTLMDTSWAAMKLGLTGYIIPFMFVFAPSLLLMGDPVEVALAALTASIGVVCLAGGLHEHFFGGPARWWERLLLIVAAFTLIKPGWISDLVGVALIFVILASQRWLLAGRHPQGQRMKLQLYAWDTPNARKITVALEEMGLAYDVQPVDITKGEQHAPEFLKLSPNNRIPALLDPLGPAGVPISVFESGAILIYLGRKSGRFYPDALAAQVPVLEWLMFQMGGFGPMPGQVHHFIALADDAERRYGLQRFDAETRRLYAVMNRRLDGREFFADQLSIADFAVLGWAWRHPRHKVDLADYVHVQRWYRTLMARPAVQRGFAVPLTRS